MLVQKYLNATESSDFLGLHKPKFYELIAQGDIEHVMQTGRIKLYAVKDLKKIRKALRG